METPKDPNYLPQFSAPKRMDVAELNLVGVEGEAFTQRFEKPAETLEQAAEIFARDGAVALAGDCPLTFVDHDGKTVETTVGEFTQNARQATLDRLQAIWNSPDRDEVIRDKNYGAYNGTERHMRTLSPEHVKKFVPEVTELQEELIPVIRRITNDDTVEVSDDPDEATVINLQLFNPQAPAGQRQEHGAHTDRVDTTAIICLDNVGDHGEFVYLKGYNDACVALGLDPHRDFLPNMTKILADAPESVMFRIYPVQPGQIAVIRTDEDVHFITAKSKSDVDQGVQQGQTPVVFGAGGPDQGEMVLGRGIINSAFETQKGRQVFEQAQAINKAYGVSKLRGDAHFEALDAALSAEVQAGRLETTDVDRVRNAFVTSMSAAQLYND
jgi:hypothetical protein